MTTLTDGSFTHSHSTLIEMGGGGGIRQHGEMSCHRTVYLYIGNWVPFFLGHDGMLRITTDFLDA
jgi:hypothetical protein